MLGSVENGGEAQSSGTSSQSQKYSPEDTFSTSVGDLYGPHFATGRRGCDTAAVTTTDRERRKRERERERERKIERGENGMWHEGLIMEECCDVVSLSLDGGVAYALVQIVRIRMECRIAT